MVIATLMVTLFLRRFQNSGGGGELIPVFRFEDGMLLFERICFHSGITSFRLEIICFRSEMVCFGWKMALLVDCQTGFGIIGSPQS